MTKAGGMEAGEGSRTLVERCNYQVGAFLQHVAEKSVEGKVGGEWEKWK